MNESDDTTKCRTRYLNDPDKVFEHNAWDDVEWTPEQIMEAERIIEKQLQNKAPESVKHEFETNAAHYWDVFYETHQDKFFKDRHWLFDEFPELRKAAKLDHTSATNADGSLTSDAAKSAPAEHATETKSTTSDPNSQEERFTVVEVGCGPGNTVIPLLEATGGSQNRVFIYACDFSPNAVRLLKSHPSYDPTRSHAFVFDVSCDDTSPYELPAMEGSCDVVLLLFLLSAVPPSRHSIVLRRVFDWLKPGGKVLFRDYAHFDLAELRFEPSSQRCLDKHEYARGDGTLACFFDAAQVEGLFTAAGFSRISIEIDRRLQTNRARKLKMYRAFLQAKFLKPGKASS